MGELSIPPLLAHHPEQLPPGRWRVLILPVLMAIAGILFAQAFAISGQDHRRERDLTILDKTRFYWENELASARLEYLQLQHLPALDDRAAERLRTLERKLPEIEQTLEKVKHYGLIGSARPGRQFTNWDGYRYEEIVSGGYVYHQPDDPKEVRDSAMMKWPGSEELRTKNVVWYPLYPLLARGVMTITGISANAALTVVAETCAVLASVLAFLYARRHFHNRIPYLHSAGEEAAAHPTRRWDLPPADSAALWVLAFLLFNPCGVFLYANYTESLFVLLLAGFLYAVQGRHWVLAALVAAVASSCRSQGVLFGPILAVTFLLRSDMRNAFLKIAAAGGLAVLSEVGLAAYMLFLERTFHDPLAFVHAQKGWSVGVNSTTIAYAMNPANALSHFLRYALYTSPMDLPRLWEAFCLLWPPIMLMVLGGRFLSFELEMTGWLMWGLPYVSNCLAGTPPGDHQWMSMGRFMAVMLPAQIILGAVFVRFRWAGIPLLASSAALFGVFCYIFGFGEWVG